MSHRAPAHCAADPQAACAYADSIALAAFAGVKHNMEVANMKSNLLTIGTLTLGLACASQASADWTDVIDPAELRALHSNTTLKGRSAGGESYYAHFYDGGVGRVVTKGASLPAPWHLNGSHEVCVKGMDGAECYRFQKTGEYETLYRAIRVGDGMAIPIKVEKGVPEF